VRETATGVRIEIEVPRYRREDVVVESDPRGLITVTGKRAVPESEGDHLLVSTGSVGGFRRAFRLSPQVYNLDLASIQVALEFGVLSLTVAKLPPPPAPQPIAIFGGDQAVTQTTPEQLEAIRKTRDVMTIKKEETAAALTYHCQLSPFVTKDHIELQLRGRLLSVAVRYVLNTSSSTESVTYATSLTVPQGTRPEDVHTEYQPGTLTITLSKPAPGTPAAISVKPAFEQQ